MCLRVFNLWKEETVTHINANISPATYQVAVAVVLPTASPGRPPSAYFHFQNISSAGNFEAGHVRGNPWHWVSRLEQQHGAANSGQVSCAPNGEKYYWSLGVQLSRISIQSD